MDAYHAMALPFDPGTYGAVSDLLPVLTYEQVCVSVRQEILDGLALAYHIIAGLAGPANAKRFDAMARP